MSRSKETADHPKGDNGDFSGSGTPLLIADNPYLALREAMVILHGFRPQPAVGISPQVVSRVRTAMVGELCTVRPFAYVAPGAQLGDRVILYPGSYVGKKAMIGNDCVLHPGVCVYDRCVRRRPRHAPRQHRRRRRRLGVCDRQTIRPPRRGNR